MCRFDKSQLPAELPVTSLSDAEERNARNSFNFELAYIKAQPVRTEPDVILVSCAAAAGTDASDSADSADSAERGAFAGPEANVLGAVEGVNARRVTLKRRGEAGLRSSGLGYCIVRPSRLLQEPGGYKALVFDQGDRIQQVRRTPADDTRVWRVSYVHQLHVCSYVMCSSRMTLEMPVLSSAVSEMMATVQPLGVSKARAASQGLVCSLTRVMSAAGDRVC